MMGRVQGWLSFWGFRLREERIHLVAKTCLLSYARHPFSI